ncbi:type VII secretion protein EccB [Rhodococcus sp. NPDC003318]|uniref:type VII secretion protein EccB n=1 Tax=Rhodococcus sp. NPDC003318 TaxID=3364503 RepID=UPI0036AF4EEB
MAAQPTTRWQVSGYRFLVRRMEHALVRRDVRMLHDPMRNQSRALAVGAIVAVIGVAGCAALALVRPQDKIGDARIVVGKDSGALFVAYADALHPVLNLASARLVAGEAANPVVVKESELGTRPRGPLLGIPGAPSALPEGDPGAWTVCDSIASGGNRALTTTVVVGESVSGGGAADLTSDEALLIQGTSGTYLVHDGKRSRVDLGDHAVVLALGLDGLAPRPASAGLLGAIPEAPAITPPAIVDRGLPAPYALQGRTIGSVVQVRDAQAATYYVVLADGLQRIGRATADLIRYADSQGTAAVEVLTPDAVARVPQSSSLAVDTFPEDPPRIVDDRTSPVSCLSWRPTAGADAGGQQASVAVMAGAALPLPDDARPVGLAQADGSGDNADRFFARPGSGALVHSTGTTESSVRHGVLFFVGDTGVRFGVENRETATMLGLAQGSRPAPWSILGMLAPGPELAREAAFLAHDGVAPDDHPVDVSPR